MREIVIVEDSKIDAERAQKALRLAGLQGPVRVFETGEEAIGYLESAQPPAIILLDIKLPGKIGGFEILDRFRNNPAFDLTLRVVFSTIDDIRTIKEVYAHGAHSFLTKPVEVEDVRNFVRNFRRWLECGDGVESKSQVS